MKHFINSLLRSFVMGMVGGIVTALFYWAFTGHSAPLLVMMLGSSLTGYVWGVWEGLVWYRKWQRVIQAYHMPALGEGIDIPHRPTDDLD